MANPKNIRYVTPKGTLKYPYLSTPDTKFNAGGEYKAEIELPEDAKLFDAKGKSVGLLADFLSQSIEDSVERFGTEHNGKKRKGKETEVTEADDAPFYIDNGSLFVKFKLKAVVEPKDKDAFTQAPVLFDAKGKKFDPPKNPWTGTTGKISFECIPYYNAKDAQAGVTLRMKAVQVINPVFGGGATGESQGFGVEEGYDSSEDDASEGFDGQTDYSDQDHAADNVSTPADDDEGDF